MGNAKWSARYPSGNVFQDGLVNILLDQPHHRQVETTTTSGSTTTWSIHQCDLE